MREARFQEQLHLQVQPAPGTKADDLFADDVPEEVKKRRNNDLLAIQNAVSLPIIAAASVRRSRCWSRAEQDGAQDTIRLGPETVTGRTMTDHIVVFEGNERLIGRTVPVRIEEATSFTLFGAVLTAEQIGAEERPPLVESVATEPRRLHLPLIA